MIGGAGAESHSEPKRKARQAGEVVHNLDITDNVVGYEQYVNVVHSLDITASGGGYEQSVNIIHSLDITAAGCGYELNVNGRAHGIY